MTGKNRLFEPIVHRSGWIDLDESTFEFLARGGRQEASEIREWMEEEWSEIPCCRRKGLENRLRSKNFKQFIEAYFELQVHRLLRRLGLEIDIEPSLAGTAKTVDFRCTAHSTLFFVEATVSGMNRLSANQNLEDVRRKITKGVAHPHSHVDLEVEGRLERTLSRECVVDPILDLLNKWPADEVRRHESNRALGSQACAPIAIVSEGAWKLTAKLRAVEPGRVGSVWGPIEVDDVAVDVSMREKLKTKASHWRSLGRKDGVAIIAINACHRLFGSEELEEEVGRVVYNDVRGRVTGLEFAHSLRDINGVLVFNNATLGRERAAHVRLYRNGQEQIPDSLKCLLHGCNLGSLLGLR